MTKNNPNDKPYEVWFFLLKGVYRFSSRAAFIFFVLLMLMLQTFLFFRTKVKLNDFFPAAASNDYRYTYTNIILTIFAIE